MSVAKAGEQFVEFVAQAGDGCWIFGFEAVGEFACGDANDDSNWSPKRLIRRPAL
jgi:hypothetical protein